MANNSHLTKISITPDNIDYYRTNIRSRIDTVKWSAGPLDPTVLELLPGLQTLDCSEAKLTSLVEFKGCPQLVNLNCRRNQLGSLEGIGNCPNLLTLDCYASRIYNLKELKGCPRLVNLNCSINQISELDGLEHCPNLQTLDCSNTRLGFWSDAHIAWRSWAAGISYPEPRLMSLRSMGTLTNLRTINCSHTGIASLFGLHKCLALEKLVCNNNIITDLSDIASPSLTHLDCSHNKLTTLSTLSKLPGLVDLKCNQNQLVSLTGIEHSTKLETLECSNNQLVSLTELEACTNLSTLVCCDNQITSLVPLQFCPKLEFIACSNNKLTSLTGLEMCSRLDLIFCTNNQIETLKEIENCPLTDIDCASNNITSLDSLAHLPMLESVYCSSNHIVSLEPIVYLQRLRYFAYDNNPISIQSIQVIRFLERLSTKVSKSVYTNGQNVHDTHIQETVCESVRHLLSDPNPILDMQSVIDSGLDERAISLIVQYCEDSTIHSVHLLTFAELFAYVWARVLASEHRSELLAILAEQITDSECKCFTGRFNRTLSVLVGFYPDIMIEISDSSRISAIILAVRDRIDPYDIEQQCTQAVAALVEAGYEESELGPWIEAIRDLD